MCRLQQVHMDNLMSSRLLTRTGVGYLRSAGRMRPSGQCYAVSGTTSVLSPPLVTSSLAADMTVLTSSRVRQEQRKMALPVGLVLHPPVFENFILVTCALKINMISIPVLYMIINSQFAFVLFACNSPSSICRPGPRCRLHAIQPFACKGCRPLDQKAQAARRRRTKFA